MTIAINILLNSHAFLRWETESKAFWVLLALFIIIYFYSREILDYEPKKFLWMNLACAGIIYLYTGMSGEVFWFLNIEKVGWLIMLFAFILTAALFGIVIGNAWGFLKLVSSITSDFWSAIIGLVIGCVWSFLLVRLGEIIFEEHPILCVITLLGGLGGQTKTSNYTPSYESSDSESSGGGGGTSPEPEPDPSPGPSPDPNPDEPYGSHGYPCCNNCKWNMNRGSYFVRCFQDESREKEPNDKCGQWQRC